MTRLSVRFADLPPAPSDADPDEHVSAALDRRFQALLDALGGDWERPDADGHAGELSVSPVESHWLLLEAGKDAATGALTVKGRAFVRHHERLTNVGFAVGFVGVFALFFIGHDVWKLPLALTLFASVVALIAPTVMVAWIARTLTREQSQRITADLEARVRRALADPALGIAAHP